MVHCVSTTREHLKPSREYAEEIRSLMDTLSPIPMVFFAYIRAFPKGVAAGLYSDAKGVQETLDRGMYAPLFDERGCLLPEGFYFSNDVPALLYNQKDPEAMTHFLEEIRDVQKQSKGSWDDGFFIVKPSQLYDEIFYFFSGVPSPVHRVFFLNHSEVLNHFCLYFISEGRKIIEKSMDYAFKYPIVEARKETEDPKALFSNSFHQETKKKMPIARYRFVHGEREVHLTQREYRCLELMSQGEKASQIASFLGVGIKGYESMSQRVKDKFGVSSKKLLVSIFLESIYNK